MQRRDQICNGGHLPRARRPRIDDEDVTQLRRRFWRLWLRATCPRQRRGGGRRCLFRAFEQHVERSNLDPVAAVLLGKIKRLVGLSQQLRHVERGRFAVNHADADGGANRPAVDFLRRGRKGFADALGHGKCFLLRGVIQASARIPRRRCGRPDRSARIDLRAAAVKISSTRSPKRVTKAIVDRFEVIEVDQKHRGRTRIAGDGACQLAGVMQEGAAVGDAGQADRSWPRYGGAVRCAPLPSPAE